MKCSDIPDVPLLWYILCVNKSDGWCTWDSHNSRNVKHGMPNDIPAKLVLAKMRMLIRRKLVSGCGCGCRGDFEITEKGKEYLKKHFEPKNRLPNL